MSTSHLVHHAPSLTPRYSRHPSYVGFFYWAIATQLLLGNIVSAIAFVFILARFFSHRIIGTQATLIMLLWYLELISR